MRVLIPLQTLVMRVFTHVEVPNRIHAVVPTHINATVFEDDSSALQLANQQIITSRTQHYAVRYHHFWENMRTGGINKQTSLPSHFAGSSLSNAANWSWDGNYFELMC